MLKILIIFQWHLKVIGGSGDTCTSIKSLQVLGHNNLCKKIFKNCHLVAN